jgi:hypothetical protein
VRRPAASAAIAAAIVVLALAGAGPVGAVPPPPANLQVEGGEERWHSKRSFRIVWQSPPPGTVAVHYRVRDPGGATAIGPVRIGWAATSVEAIEVPAQPGAYTLEAWLEDAAGQTGPAAVAKLRFDDARPGEVAPAVPATWIGRTAFPLTVRLGRPAGPVPISGIRGYAVEVARPPGREPCAAGTRCSDAEVDLRGGIDDDAYRIADLPHGTTLLRAVAVSGSGMASPLSGSAVLRVDELSPVVDLFGVPDGWVNHPVSLLATAADRDSGMAPAGGGGVAPFTGIAIDGGAPVVAPGAVASTIVIGEGIHRIAYYARDLAGNVDDGGESNGVANATPAAAIVRIDRRPPSASFANSQASSEPELIRARVADAMSGPDPGRGWIGVRRAGSGDRFAPLPPAPGRRGDEVRAIWDSDAYPAGEYQFRAVAYDAAGNATATVQRADGRPMRLRSPLKARTLLRSGFGGRATERTIPYGRGSLLTGSLKTAAGTPLGGQPVRIVERQPAPDGAPIRVSTATTGSGGAFRHRLAPGASREVVASFAGTPTLARSASPALRLLVRSSIGLRVSAPTARVGGPPIVFRGRVAAEPETIPAEGKSVQLQFRLPGLPWSEFRTIQTDRRGRFRYAYRFSDDDSRGAIFRFRAYAPAQAGWPFEPAGSRPVTVRGR